MVECNFASRGWTSGLANGDTAPAKADRGKYVKSQKTCVNIRPSASSLEGLGPRDELNTGVDRVDSGFHERSTATW